MIQLETKRNNEKRTASATSWALDNLPRFPVVATRLMQMLSKDDVDITEIGRTIAMEPVFATRVLQMANSPLFALQGEVKTISHAIVLLGLKRVKAITITRALGDFVAPVLKVRALRVCWQNSLAAAILSEKLARACKMDPDFAYVAGLLRDIGRLALLVKYPEPYANLLAVSEENSFDLLATERDLFDVNHCQAGVLLMEKLGFPPEFHDVVAHHHDTPSGGAFRMAHLVRIADLLADALGFGVLKSMSRPRFEEVVEQLPASARSRFEVDPEVLSAEIDAKIQAWH